MSTVMLLALALGGDVLTPPAADTLKPPAAPAPDVLFARRAVEPLGPPPAPKDYPAARKAVEGGATVLVVVGGAEPPASPPHPVYTATAADLEGFAPGVYLCYPLDGVPKIETTRWAPAPPARPGLQLSLGVTGPLGNTVGVCVGRA